MSVACAEVAIGSLRMVTQRIRPSGIELLLAEGPDTGPPLLLLPGMLDLWTDYHAVLPSLSARFRLLVLEHRGHGASGRAARDDYRVIDYADDVIGVVESHVRRPVLISGNSLGGMVALNVAARRPDLVRAIAIEDAPLLVTEGSGWRSHWSYPFFVEVTAMLESWRASGAGCADLAGRIAALPLYRPRLEQDPARRAVACDRILAGLRAAGALTEAEAARVADGWQSYLAGVRPTMGACLPRVLIDNIARDWASVDPSVPRQAATQHINEGFDHLAALAAVRCPVLLWEADRDLSGIVPPRDVERVTAHLAHVPHQYVYAEGAGHQIHRDLPQLFCGRTIDFFARSPA